MPADQLFGTAGEAWGKLSCWSAGQGITNNCRAFRLLIDSLVWTCKSTTTTANTYAGKWKIKEKEKQKETEVGGKGHICADVLSSWQVTACSKKKKKKMEIVLPSRWFCPMHICTQLLSWHMSHERSWRSNGLYFCCLIFPRISENLCISMVKKLFALYMNTFKTH